MNVVTSNCIPVENVLPLNFSDLSFFIESAMILNILWSGIEHSPFENECWDFFSTREMYCCHRKTIDILLRIIAFLGTNRVERELNHCWELQMALMLGIWYLATFEIYVFFVESAMILNIFSSGIEHLPLYFNFI